MKTPQLISLITLLTVLSVPYLSFAQGFQAPPPGGITNPPDIPTKLFSCDPNDSLRICLLKLLDDTLKVIIVIAIALAAIFLAIAGITYISSPSKKDDAKNRIIYAVVGLVVALLAWIITLFLANIISGGGTKI